MDGGHPEAGRSNRPLEVRQRTGRCRAAQEDEQHQRQLDGEVERRRRPPPRREALRLRHEIGEQPEREAQRGIAETFSAPHRHGLIGNEQRAARSEALAGVGQDAPCFVIGELAQQEGAHHQVVGRAREPVDLQGRQTPQLDPLGEPLARHPLARRVQHRLGGIDAEDARAASRQHDGEAAGSAAHVEHAAAFARHPAGDLFPEVREPAERQQVHRAVVAGGRGLERLHEDECRHDLSCGSMSGDDGTRTRNRRPWALISPATSPGC